LVRQGVDDITRELPTIRDTAHGVATLQNELLVLRRDVSAILEESSTTGNLSTVSCQFPSVQERQREATNIAAIEVREKYRTLPNVGELSTAAHLDEVSCSQIPLPPEISDRLSDRNLHSRYLHHRQDLKPLPYKDLNKPGE
jgi:hypothetical protein